MDSWRLGRLQLTISAFAVKTGASAHAAPAVVSEQTRR
jgi:hypothetical protein